MTRLATWLLVTARTLIPWILAYGLLGCGTDSYGPLSNAGEHLDSTAGGSNQARGSDQASGVGADRDARGGLTLADALKSAGESGPADDRAEAGPSDQAHVDAVQRQKILDAVPGDQVTLARTLQESSVPLQLLALDRLGEMAAWDHEAQGILQQFRSNEGNEEGLRRRAAYLLNEASHPAAHHAEGDEPG